MNKQSTRSHHLTKSQQCFSCEGISHLTRLSLVFSVPCEDILNPILQYKNRKIILHTLLPLLQRYHKTIQYKLSANKSGIWKKKIIADDFDVTIWETVVTWYNQWSNIRSYGVFWVSGKYVFEIFFLKL